MCVSHHNIEQQAYHFAEQIRQYTKYRPLYIEFIGEGSFAFEQGEPLPANNPGVISKIVLADKEGNQYRIEPDELGLQFARGEIDYKEYLYQQKKENKQLIGLTLVLVAGFGITGWGFIALLL
ncbi:hypothetical protein DYI25_17810 [Mesobacillus boroniphilus]|uniref:Uncharacterized protein n=1 Tax=Mesobacillus boroniphilus TaxID=308892 RepID=A0A944CPL9_9BACI|nr:hypothetical protein [Mesobacillus boroniphilus]MBS8266281.1 hypothetical protein [Mesobacillus boroniphilus]